jgi:hypothetical protein
MANDNANEAARDFARARWPYVDPDHKAIGAPRDAHKAAI